MSKQIYLTLLQPIIPPEEYPLASKTIGEHIKKNRFDLGLFQNEVTEKIGITELTVWNWEHGIRLHLCYIRGVLWCGVNGLSYERLGDLMGHKLKPLLKESSIDLSYSLEDVRDEWSGKRLHYEYL